MSRKFPARFESLAGIGQFVRTQAQQSGFDEKSVYQVEMAVDEACSNIIEHAYGSRPASDNEIALTCHDSPDGLTIIIRDSGIPFDPTLVEMPDVNAGLEDRAEHGLGMFFIREWMDKVHYENDLGGNILTMFKRKRGSSKTARVKNRH